LQTTNLKGPKKPIGKKKNNKGKKGGGSNKIAKLNNNDVGVNKDKKKRNLHCKICK
jgi:hypothetical protein